MASDADAECPNCGDSPGTVYRCQECGADLLGRTGGEQG